jgi:REP element-mobilizing transposase RayT
VAVQEREQTVGGFYHVTLRGARQLPIFFDDRDRRLFLSLLKPAVRKFRWRCYAWCLMDNHFHLVIELTVPTLSNGMFTLNHAYACWLNRRHGYKGHAFDRRFSAREIETTPHLLEASRYILLNPVRAGARARPEEYRWSSYLGLIGRAPRLFAEEEWLLAQFGRRRERAIENFIAFVEDGLPRLASPVTTS